MLQHGAWHGACCVPNINKIKCINVEKKKYFILAKICIHLSAVKYILPDSVNMKGLCMFEMNMDRKQNFPELAT